MKKIQTLALFAIGLAGALTWTATSARADFEVSASVPIHATADFTAPLSSCGTWVEVGPYGRCWRPAGIVVGWRPYCNGYWVWTDCGWYWASDEPWAWACYHYGSWVYDPDYGWIWVPGVEWAPAWVCWRFGGGFVGWAPIGFHAHHPDAAAFVFVDNNHFGGHISSRTVIVNNPAIIRQTRFISNTKPATRNFDGSSRKVIVNEGPGLAVMEKATGRKFSAVPISTAVRRTPLPSSFRHEAVPAEIKHEAKPVAPPTADQPWRKTETIKPPVGPPPNQGMPFDKGEPPPSRGNYVPQPGGGQGGGGHGNHGDHGHDHN